MTAPRLHYPHAAAGGRAAYAHRVPKPILIRNALIAMPKGLLKI